jgi:ParB-like chromosome segregation protein Spo0J
MSAPVMFQALPPLSPEEYVELERSILENGVMVPIVLDENGVVIDGHHRQQIAQHHNLPCPSETKAGFSDTEKRGLALSLNLHRRHLTREQKRALVAESIKADPQLSDREHGRRTGVHKDTAGAVRQQLEKSGEIGHFSERIDPRTGNASQPARRPPAPKPPATDLISADELAELNAPVVHPMPDPPAAEPEPDAAERKSNRSPLPEAFWRAAVEMRKCIERVERLVDDDRFSKNSGQIAERNLADLTRARDALQRVINQLTPGV